MPPSGIAASNSGGAKARTSSGASRPWWLNLCLRDAKGRPLNNLSNAMIALRNDEDVRYMLAYDEMYCGEVMLRNIGSKTDDAAATGAGC